MRHFYLKRLRELAAIALVALIVLVAPKPAHAQIPVTDVASLAEEVQSYTQQVAQYTTEVSMLQNMLQNTKDLSGGGKWTNIAQAMSSISSAVQRGTSLANTGSNLEQQFSRTFPNYGTMLGTTITPQSYQANYKTWSNNTQQGLQTGLSASNAVLNQSTTDQTRLSSLQTQAAGTDGELQAIKSVGAVTTESLAQLQALKILIAQTSAAQNQFLAQRQATEDSSAASTQQALSGSSPAFGSGKSY
jgi:P-type conjugative transfer protein TrbJ